MPTTIFTTTNGPINYLLTADYTKDMTVIPEQTQPPTLRMIVS